jgi:hypothetical protein
VFFARLVDESGRSRQSTAIQQKSSQLETLMIIRPAIERGDGKSDNRT